MEVRRPDPDGEAIPLLEARGLSKSFRGLQALVDYELRLTPLTIHGVIGPNGAGKTTLFHLLSGFLRPIERHDRVRRLATSPARQPTQSSRMGIGRTFQNIRLFGDLSVLDNVKVGLAAPGAPSLVGTLLSSPSFRRSERELEAQALELLQLFGLAQQRDRLARNLPYGDQRRLEIARAVGDAARGAAARRAQCRHEPDRDAGPARPHPSAARRARASRSSSWPTTSRW